MKVYISGPISGTTDYMGRFAEAQKYLESRGYSVVNPALVNSNLPEDTSYDDYMKMSFCMLDMCNAIYMLKNYTDSNGALLELERAKINSYCILYEAIVGV